MLSLLYKQGLFTIMSVIPSCERPTYLMHNKTFLVNECFVVWQDVITADITADPNTTPIVRQETQQNNARHPN